MMKYLIFTVFLFTVTFSWGQNTDSLFQKARELAFSGNRSEARKVCQTVLKLSPTYVDAKVLIGRTYCWDSKYDSARIELKQVIEAKPNYYDAISALIDCELWSEHNEEAIKHCDYGLKSNPNDEEFLLKKAKALRNLKRYEEAIAILKDILKRNPNNQKASDLLTAIRIEMAKYKMSVGYTVDISENNSPVPAHLYNVQLSRKTPIGGLIGRANIANRFETWGWQYEADLYPNISAHNYGYLNVGYSQSSIFPKWRFGAEWYHSFPFGFEASAGFRYLIFSSSDVMIYTAYVGKYWGNYWFSFRTFITPASGDASVSGIFLMRRYFSDASNYVGIQLGYGISPDDSRKTVDSEKILKLKSQKIKIAYSKKFHDFWTLSTGVAYEHSEYRISSYRNIYSIDISIDRIF